jgi:hypothetical protein
VPGVDGLLRGVLDELGAVEARKALAEVHRVVRDGEVGDLGEDRLSEAGEAIGGLTRGCGGRRHG